MQEVSWSKFVLTEPEGTKPPKQRKPKPKKPRPAAPSKPSKEPAFWEVRRDCDSADVYDSDRCYAAMIALDWKRACEDGRLERLILRSEKRSGGDGDDSDEAGELGDCEEVLRSHARLIYALYDEYSLHGGSDDTNDIFSGQRDLHRPTPP